MYQTRVKTTKQLFCFWERFIQQKKHFFEFLKKIWMITTLIPSKLSFLSVNYLNESLNEGVCEFMLKNTKTFLTRKRSKNVSKIAFNSITQESAHSTSFKPYHTEFESNECEKGVMMHLKSCKHSSKKKKQVVRRFQFITFCTI